MIIGGLSAGTPGHAELGGCQCPAAARLWLLCLGQTRVSAVAFQPPGRAVCVLCPLVLLCPGQTCLCADSFQPFWRAVCGFCPLVLLCSGQTCLCADSFIRCGPFAARPWLGPARFRAARRVVWCLLCVCLAFGCARCAAVDEKFAVLCPAACGVADSVRMGRWLLCFALSAVPCVQLSLRVKSAHGLLYTCKFSGFVTKGQIKRKKFFIEVSDYVCNRA